MLSWMNDKEGALVGDVQDIDLETVRKMQRKHQVCFAKLNPKTITRCFSLNIALHVIMRN